MFKTITLSLLLATLAFVSTVPAGQAGLSFEDNTTLSFEDNTTLGVGFAGFINEDASTISAETAAGDSWSLFDVPVVE